MPSETIPWSSVPCSCGDRTRPNINHRKRIPCWTYIGQTRCDVTENGLIAEYSTNFDYGVSEGYDSEWAKAKSESQVSEGTDSDG